MIRRRPWVAAFLFALLSSAVLGAFVAKNALADYKAEKARAFAKRVDEGDIALFRCLTGQRPTWLPVVIEKYRQEGITAYTAALQYDPHAVRPLVQRARLYASQKATLDLALADLDKAQQLRPGFTSIRKFRGHVLQELGRDEESRTAGEEAKNLYPTAAEDLYWLGVIAYSKEQDYVESHKYFSQALLISANDYWSRLERAYFGRIPSEEDNRPRVTTELDIAKTIRPDLPFASELLVASKFDPMRTKKELEEQIERFGLDILRAHDLSELLQKEKKYDEAEAILQQFLDQDEGGRTAERIGHLEYDRGHYEQARNWYRRAIDEGAKNPVSYLNLAHACIAIRDETAAESAYLEGMAQYPNHAFLCWNLGSWYESRGRDADAEATYRRGCQLPLDREGPSWSRAEQTSDLVSCYRHLTLLLGRLGRRPESNEVLEQGVAHLAKRLKTTNAGQPQMAMALERDLFELKGALGQGYVRAGRRQDALSLIDTELKTKPVKSRNASTIIDLLQLLGMGQSALGVARLAEFTTQRDAPPGDRTSRLLARRLVERQLLQMGLLKELLDRLETRRALGEELDVLEYSYLGTIYEGPEAVGILGEAVKKHPDSVGLHSDYMQVLAKAGRKEEAWKAYLEARDLYFAKVARSEVPSSIGSFEFDNLLPPVKAEPWYTYLLQEEKLDEFQWLENRLVEACSKTMSKPEELFVPRATAEFAAHKYGAAAKSLEICLQKKLGNEAWVTGALARSLRALGRRQDAIKSYRRAVQLSDVEPGLLSEFLMLVVEDQGVEGLLRELPTYEQTWSRLNLRVNAILSCFSAWAALSTGDENGAFEKLVLAGPYNLLASQQPTLGSDEGLVCAIILTVLWEKLADSKRLPGPKDDFLKRFPPERVLTTDFLKRFPDERVRAIRDVFSLPKPK